MFTATTMIKQKQMQQIIKVGAGASMFNLGGEKL